MFSFTTITINRRNPSTAMLQNHCQYEFCQRKIPPEETSCSKLHTRLIHKCLVPGCDHPRMVDDSDRVSLGCSDDHARTIKMFLKGHLDCDLRPLCDLCTNKLPDGRLLHTAIITGEDCACPFIERCENCEQKPQVITWHCSDCDSQ